MSTTSNRSIVEAVFSALAQGERQPFADAMADDFSWTIAGGGPWARTRRGKGDVRRGLMAPLFAQFAGIYRNRAARIVCDGDVIVVECRGEVATKAGQRYDNQYCYVIEMREGKMIALTEYMDTALAEAVLSPPPA